VNHGEVYPDAPRKVISQFGLTWMQRGYLVNL
jgi:hypothetical protein